VHIVATVWVTAMQKSRRFPSPLHVCRENLAAVSRSGTILCGPVQNPKSYDSQLLLGSSKAAVSTPTNLKHAHEVTTARPGVVRGVMSPAMVRTLLTHACVSRLS
jgi:hypothetical protein